MKKESKKKVEKKDKKFTSSVDKWVEDRMGEKRDILRELRGESMQLYQQGLLSAETVLDVYGFDPNQEISRKKENVVDLKNRNNSLREYSDIEVKQIRIEQARRNVEAMVKLLPRMDKELTPYLLSNLKIMNEVEKI